MRNYKEKNTWYLDIETNNYRRGLKNIFVEFDKLKSVYFTFGDTFKILVKWKRKILICLKIEDIYLFEMSTMY